MEVEVGVSLTGVFCELVSHDMMFEAVADKAIIVNNFNVRDEADKERLDSLLYTEYEGDTLDTKPSCDCGKVQGEFNKGIRCSNCGTVVSTVTDRPLEPTLWLQVPDGVRAFISPQAWSILNAAFRYRGVSLIHWLCDSTYTPPNAQVKEVLASDAKIERIRQYGWTRSINFFADHFDEIIGVLLEMKFVTPVRQRDLVETFINENRNRIFSQYLPIPNRAVFITEKSQVGQSQKYADHAMYDAIDAVRTITSLVTSITPPSQRVKENKTVKVIHQLSSYYNDYVAGSLSSKPGMFRKQVYGARLDTSGRAVITSLSHPHDYDETHFPWGMSVMMLKSHLTNKLLKRGMTPNECEEFLMRHTLKHHSLLEQLLSELIAESPYKGIPIILQRNPTLVRGSAQQLYVTKIKTDPKINSISLSVLVLKAPNADFDGDEMNTFLQVDSIEHQAFSRLAPHLGVMDTHVPFKVSGNIGIPGPIIATISNWMHENE